jgi:hypothetical protein
MFGSGAISLPTGPFALPTTNSSTSSKNTAALVLKLTITILALLNLASFVLSITESSVAGMALHGATLGATLAFLFIFKHAMP